MKTTKIITTAAIGALLIWSCGNNTTKSENTEISQKTEEVIVEEVAEDNSTFGVYTLTDMIPITGDKELKEQDIKYISQSKERTLNKTKLSLNEDGSFTRVFPSPREDGTEKTWTGTYKVDEEANTITMTVSFGEKNKDITFKVLENTGKKLSLVSSFGQIEMNYVYTK